MKDSKTKVEESTRLTYTGLCHSCCHTYLERSETSSLCAEVGSVCRVPLREPMYLCTCVSGFAEVGSVCRVALREPIHLCTCVREEGDDGETVCSETPSLLSYTLRYVHV
jgi:hypothetical protein